MNRRNTCFSSKIMRLFSIVARFATLLFAFQSRFSTYRWKEDQICYKMAFERILKLFVFFEIFEFKNYDEECYKVAKQKHSRLTHTFDISVLLRNTKNFYPSTLLVEFIIQLDLDRA